MKKLNSQTSQSVIAQLMSIFAGHGIPEILISDNGSQFSSDRDFLNLCERIWCSIYNQLTKIPTSKIPGTTQLPSYTPGRTVTGRTSHGTKTPIEYSKAKSENPGPTE